MASIQNNLPRKYSPISSAFDTGLPSGWRIVSLKKLIQSGRNIRYGIVQPGAFDPKGTYMVRGQDYSNGWAEPEALFKVGAEVEIRYRKARLKSGDLIITIVGASTGRVAIVPDWLEDANITQTTARIAIDPDKADPRYCYNYLISQFGQRFTYHYVKGGAQPGLNVGDVEKFDIVLPPMPVQKRLVSLFDAWDKAIEQVSKLIDAKTRLKKGLMQQLLTGKKRFPEFKGAEWREYRLGDLFRERKERGNVDLPLLSITADRGVISRDEVDRKDTSNPDKEKYLRIRSGDIGYNTMRMWQGVSGLSKLDGIVSPAYTIVILGKRILGNYAAYLFKSPPIVHLFHRYSQGLVDDTLNLKFRHFAQIKVTVPTVPEQDRIAGVLDVLDENIARLTNLKGRLELQKRGLMQVLLTGKKRVRIDEFTNRRA